MNEFKYEGSLDISDDGSYKGKLLYGGVSYDVTTTKGPGKVSERDGKTYKRFTALHTAADGTEYKLEGGLQMMGGTAVSGKARPEFRLFFQVQDPLAGAANVSFTGWRRTRREDGVSFISLALDPPREQSEFAA